MATKSRTVAEIEAVSAGIRYVGPAYEGTERVIVGEGRRREMGRTMAATSTGWTATEILRVEWSPAAFLGHRSPATTEKFYAPPAVPEEE